MPPLLPTKRQRDRPLTTTEVVQGLSKAIRSALPAGAMPGSAHSLDINAIVREASLQLAPSIGVTPDEITTALIEQGMGYEQPLAPGRPLNPYFGYGRQPRAFNYNVGRNISTRPRQYRIPFDVLRGLIERYDIAQICIRHIIDDLRSMPLQFTAVGDDDVQDDIAKAREFWLRPDGVHDWPEWLGMWMQDVLRFDGGCLYRRKGPDGKLEGLDIVDTTTIAPLIDYYGRRPVGKAPAYLQFVAGLPWDWLTADDVIYTKLNPIPEDVYGVAPIESVMMTANIDLRFQWHFLNFFTEGTVPDGFMEAPPDQSNPDQVQIWQEAWESWLAGDQGQKHKIRWVPAGSSYKPSKTAQFDPTFPTYLLRRTVASYGLVPHDLGFLEDVNRSTGDTQMDVQFRISTAPKSISIEYIMNRITQQDLGLRVAVSFDTGREKEDRLMEAQAHQLYVFMGAESPDEVRRDVLGLEVNPEEMVPRFVMSERLGVIPLRYLASVAGEIDIKTGSPVQGTITPQELVLPGQKEPNPPLGDRPIDDVTMPADTNSTTEPADNSDVPISVVSKQTTVVASGIAVLAKDTGRCLMLQRGLQDPTDPAGGCWELPGGCLEPGENPQAAAIREWSEEVGQLLPTGQLTATWISPNNVYQGFVYIIESEDLVGINADNPFVVNPDDPDGDHMEVACWWDVCDIPGIPNLRSECRSTPWGLIQQEIDGVRNAIQDPDFMGVEPSDDDPMDVAAVKEILRQWRDNSRTRVKKGLPPRMFLDEELPPELTEFIWSRLQGVRTREGVDEAFQAD